MIDFTKKTHDTLMAINEMCEVLEKALGTEKTDPRGYLAGVHATQSVPDYSPEQIFAARGSEMPVEDTPPEVESQEQPRRDALPEVPQEVVRNLEEYTPERLHAIVQHASKSIADALIHSIMAHRAPDAFISPVKAGKPDQEEQ